MLRRSTFKRREIQHGGRHAKFRVESLCILLNDCLDKLKTIQLDDIPITIDNTKLKWCGSFESLKIFVNTTLNNYGR